MIRRIWLLKVLEVLSDFSPKEPMTATALIGELQCSTYKTKQISTEPSACSNPMLDLSANPEK